MKVAIAVHGTRGDVEPALAVAVELLRRGHEVRMAVPPNLVGFAKSVLGLPVASYGPDSHRQLETEVFRTWWNLRNPITALRQARDYVVDGWAEMNETLTALAADADLVLTVMTYQELAANIAEARAIPFAALHYFPLRANTHILPVRVHGSLAKLIWMVAEWAHWRLLKPAYDRQRRTLGLPESRIRAIRKIVEADALEIQIYDRAFFPGLDEEWNGKRPIVGTLSLELATAADEPVMSWIETGRPPIFFGFGSMPVDNPADAVAMIVKVCRDLGERALICSGVWTLDNISPATDIMIVPSVNYSVIFPCCRAIVHHGGSGTTAASVRSGIPTLVLWVGADQPLWARQVKRLGVGTGRRLSTTTPETLREDLLRVLEPGCGAKAQAVARQMTQPRQNVNDAADRIEGFVSGRGT